MVTRRCTQRQHLLRPDAETVNAFIYCLAVAAQKYEVTLLGFIQMSNHLHDVGFDPGAQLPAFYEHFHKLLAKCMNASRGRWENFFSSHRVNVVRLEDVEDIIDRLVYVITNPVTAGLVERAESWPGASGYRALITGEPLRATRPRHFFAEDGAMPEQVELYVTIPPQLGDKDQIVAEIQRRVRAVEEAEALARARTGRRVMGAAAVVRQSWQASPATFEPRRRLRPTVAAKQLASRVEALQRRREFIADYRNARKAMIAKRPIPFPFGTYALRRYLNVAVETSEKMS